MCGIAGLWNLKSGRPASAAALAPLIEALRHRGPDESGHWVEGPLALGSARLCVIDPARGRQPMASEDGAVRVVYNGEIYNTAELRTHLLRRGHPFHTHSDTEVVVRAFVEWGADCVERLHGMFAFAVWDARRGELVLARDRLGIKPLYYHEGTDGIAFASELKALLLAPGVAFRPDLESVDEFMTWEYVPAPRTIARDVMQLEPGTLLRVGGPGGTSSPHRYWQLSAGSPPAGVAAATEQLRGLLQSAVRTHLQSDVPVGMFLSGGIDSSILACEMRRAGPVRAFTLRFEDESYDESGWARRIASHVDATHRETSLAPITEGDVRRAVAVYDEPLADTSVFALLRLSAFAREDVTVVLSGDGGDELFAGYDNYRAHRWAHRLRRLAGSAPWSFVERVIERLPPTSVKKGWVNTAKRFMRGMQVPSDLEHARWWVFQNRLERQSLYLPDLLNQLNGRDPLAHYRRKLAEGAAHGFEGLNRQLYADVTGYLADDLLVKLDRASMAVSLEARVPFLDHTLVEYAFTLPAAWKLDGAEGKRILRAAYATELPRSILRRRKQGFSVPVKQWLRGPLRTFMRTVLDGKRIAARGWFDAMEVRRLMDEHERGRANHAHRLWCLLMLELSLDRLATIRADVPA